MAQLRIKAVPGASATHLAGWLGDELKIRVAAPPQRGAANAAILKLLAHALGLHPSDLRIVHGHASAHKLIEAANLTELDLHRRLPPR